MAHEIGHVANGDMVTLALIQGVVNTFVIFLSRIIGHLVDRVVFKTERGHGPAFWITAIVDKIAVVSVGGWFAGVPIVSSAGAACGLKRLSIGHGH